MPITVTQLRRLEIWSDWECAGGVRRAVLARSAQRIATSALDGTDQLTFVVPANSVDAGFCTMASIVRTDQADGSELVVWAPDWSTYADSAAFHAAWTESDPSNLVTWDLSGTHEETSTSPVPHVNLGGVTFPGPYTSSMTYTVTGLTPGKTYRARYDAYGTGFVSIPPNTWVAYQDVAVVADGSGSVAVSISIIVPGAETVPAGTAYWYDNIRLIDPALGDPIADEWAITGVSDADSDGLVHVTAAPFRAIALGSSAAGLVQRTDADGVVVYDFDSVGLTPTAHLQQWILPRFAAAGMPYVTLGTIESTARIDLTFAWDTPLAALLTLATKAVLELQVRRTGATGYAIDLLAAIGASAPVADIRAAKNLINLALTRVRAEQATRVYPRGQADSDNLHATMARATWNVTGTAAGSGPSAGNTLVMLGDAAGGAGPIAFDTQLTGTYLRGADGTLHQVVTSAVADQHVELVGTGLAIAAGDVIEFRADATGTDLTALESPADVAAWGVIPFVWDQADTPGHRNLVPNAALRTWTGASSAPPDGWVTVGPNGTPTLLKTTTAPYVESAGQSCKVTGAAGLDGSGLATAVLPITPTAANPYLSGYGRLWVVSGSVRVELVFTTPTGTVVHPAAPNVASNSVVGQFESLGIAGEDANLLGATAVQLRIVQNGDAAAVWYISGAQVTVGASQLPFVEGSGGTQLWQAANARLLTNGPPPLTVAVALADLAQLDPVRFAGDGAFTVGGRVLVTHPTRGIALGTRVTSLTRNYDAPGNTTLVLSSNPKDLTGTLAGTGRKARASANVTGPNSGFADGPTLEWNCDAAGELTIDVEGKHGAVKTYVAARLDRFPTTPEILAGLVLAQQTGALDTGLVVPVGRYFYVGAISESSLGVQSNAVSLSEQWLGVDTTPIPTVAFGTPVIQQGQISWPVTFGLATQRVDFYVRYTDADPAPGSAVAPDVEYLASDVFEWFSRGEAAVVNGVLTLIVPLYDGSHWVTVTAVPTDALHQRGPKTSVKAQGPGAVIAARPGAPVLSNPVHTSNSVGWDIARGSGAATTSQYRLYINGAPLVTIACSGASQSETYLGIAPGTPYSVTMTALSAAGVEGPVSNALTITTDADTSGGGAGTGSNGKLPTPVYSGGVSYSRLDQAASIPFAFGTGTPSGIMLILLSSSTIGGFYAETSEYATASPAVTSINQDVSPQLVYYKLLARDPLGVYTDSDLTAAITVHVPAGSA